MSTANTPNYFRRRIGRAASPPTWACYEQIPYDDEDDCSDSGSESCSEDEEDYSRAVGEGHSDSEDDEHGHKSPDHDPAHDMDIGMEMEMDVDIDGEVGKGSAAATLKKASDAGGPQKDVKGKQRAVDPEPTPPSRRQKKKERQHTFTLRPILTIHRSQGFVWNQDLFVPPYIKDRYVASTSPPNASGFISTSASSTASALSEYEVEVVEIRVQEGDLNQFIP